MTNAVEHLISVADAFCQLSDYEDKYAVECSIQVTDYKGGKYTSNRF